VFRSRTESPSPAAVWDKGIEPGLTDGLNVRRQSVKRNLSHITNARTVSPGISIEGNDFRSVGKELAQPFREGTHRLV
jgi:hypothetical protein